MAYTYPYPRPAVTVDILVFDISIKPQKLLLIQRKNPPFENCWALPGGFIEMNETLIESALRELKEETGLVLNQLEQLHTFGDPGRDPRHRTISVAFVGLISAPEPIFAGDDAANASWFSIENLPELAFDHDKIIQQGIDQYL
ncbi:MAG: NUDIX hydrolase [Bacteroidetes bacterium]|nr:NUDIX hydrolase [Bacteroidota bacterium]MBU1578517.1 NUDIX hydrolase [Bacteroidota bacterium]MBU2465730.1 NUDIX hydrolase [Bacteroidota bacterium]MBU2558770.1 NUDIX hydrolase [Bacteroidota bacterium]